MIERRHRRWLWAAAMVCALGAVLLPIATGGDLTPLQWTIAAAALLLFGFAPMWRHVLVPAVALVAAEAMLSLPDTEFPLFAVPLAGVFALAAADAMSVLSAWRTVGVIDVAIEQTHLRAIGRRGALGAAAAGALMLIGLIELPSPAVTAAVGSAAAATVLILVATRPAR